MKLPDCPKLLELPRPRYLSQWAIPVVNKRNHSLASKEAQSLVFLTVRVHEYSELGNIVIINSQMRSNLEFDRSIMERGFIAGII